VLSSPADREWPDDISRALKTDSEDGGASMLRRIYLELCSSGLGIETGSLAGKVSVSASSINSSSCSSLGNLGESGEPCSFSGLAGGTGPVFDWVVMAVSSESHSMRGKLSTWPGGTPTAEKITH
jgi:hypothetical protein